MLTNNFVLLKKISALIWLLVVVFTLIFLLFNPQFLAVDYLQAFFSRFENQIWIAYVIISALRGFILIPSTPFVVVGALLFPQHEAWVLFISLFGLFVSASFLYFFADWLGLSDYLQQKYPNKINKLITVFQHKYAFLLVMGWAFFPLVPTDLICYIARLVKMPYSKMMAGILLGEAVLVLALVYFL